MCGITAVVSNEYLVSIAEVSQMTNLVDHRGPDGSGIWVNAPQGEKSWVGMGHTRLSILDLSPDSNQPFISKNRRFALTFNGEIYNFLELRKELQAKGHQFVTTGDTEVLLAALIEWKLDALTKLRGMFAFVFVDLLEKQIIAARDEFGIKPLYILKHESSIYFASEIKQFSAIQNRSCKVNVDPAVDFLLFGITDHRKETLFQHVEHVMPGEYIQITVRENLKVERCSWRQSHPQLFQGSYEEAHKEYRRLFLQSIDFHLRSDVPIGSCLSGGLDSSAIVGVVASKFAANALSQHTFTATSEDPTINEARYAQAVVDRTNAIAHFVEPSADLLWDEIELLAWHQDEPFGSTSIYAQWNVFNEAKRNGIKVMLDGQGADEQLGGYNSFINTHLGAQLRQGRLNRFVPNFASFHKAGRVNALSFAQYFVYTSLNENLIRFFGRNLGIASQNHLGWVNRDIVSSRNSRDPFRIRGKVPQTVRDLSTDMVYRSNLPMLLRFEDRNSMAHGVEARVPFVDGPLMHFALSLPPNFLMRADITKPLLRDSVGDFLPDLVLNRRDKIGFQTAEEMWFKNSQPKVLGLIDEAIERLPTLFSEQTKDKALRALTGRESFNNVPWRILSMLFWARAHGVEE